jgi:D-amino-acid dehydrogenase
MRVLVIGAGVIGMATAASLHAAGIEVTVVDRASGPGRETSFANGSLLHPSLVEPWNSPGVLKTLLRNLGREDAAVLLRLRALPSLLGWGLEFVRQSTPLSFEHNALRNLRLAQYSLRQFAQLRERSGIRYHSYQRGLLTLFRDRSAQHEVLAWYQLLAAHGLIVQPLDTLQTVEKEPALQAVETKLVGSVFALHDEGGDPHAFCVELARYLEDHGVKFRFEQTVTRLVRAGGRVAAAELQTGEQLTADHYVLAAGAYSVDLARAVGVRLPVRPAKGYSLTLPRVETAPTPQIPAVDTSLHMAVVPVGADRLRVAGTAEFTGYDTTINPARTANLLRLLQQLYPELARTLDGVDPSPWTGLRAMCPDGVPLIGPSGLERLWINTGHGHVGWTLAAGSGQLVADLLVGAQPALTAVDYDPRRFG